jgi:hypothetical protein
MQNICLTKKQGRTTLRLLKNTNVSAILAHTNIRNRWPAHEIPAALQLVHATVRADKGPFTGTREFYGNFFHLLPLSIVHQVATTENDFFGCLAACCCFRSLHMARAFASVWCTASFWCLGAFECHGLAAFECLAAI